MIDVRNFYLDVVTAKITNRGVPTPVDYKAPSDGRGFRVVDVVPIVYDGAGAVSSAVETRDQVTMLLRSKDTRAKYIDTPADVFVFQEIQNNPLWSGWFFNSGENFTFTFEVTSLLALGTSPWVINLHLIGYTEP